MEIAGRYKFTWIWEFQWRVQCQTAAFLKAQLKYLKPNPPLMYALSSCFVLHNWHNFHTYLSQIVPVNAITGKLGVFIRDRNGSQNTKAHKT